MCKLGYEQRLEQSELGAIRVWPSWCPHVQYYNMASWCWYDGHVIIGSYICTPSPSCHNRDVSHRECKFARVRVNASPASPSSRGQGLTSPAAVRNVSTSPGAAPLPRPYLFRAAAFPCFLPPLPPSSLGSLAGHRQAVPWQQQPWSLDVEPLIPV